VTSGDEMVELWPVKLKAAVLGLNYKFTRVSHCSAKSKWGCARSAEGGWILDSLPWTTPVERHRNFATLMPVWFGSMNAPSG